MQSTLAVQGRHLGFIPRSPFSVRVPRRCKAFAVEILHIRCNAWSLMFSIWIADILMSGCPGLCKNGCKSICHVNGTFRWSSVRSGFFEYCSQPTSFERAEWPFDLGKSRRSLYNGILLEMPSLKAWNCCCFLAALVSLIQQLLLDSYHRRQLRQFHPLIVFVVAPQVNLEMKLGFQVLSYANSDSFLSLRGSHSHTAGDVAIVLPFNSFWYTLLLL